MKRTGSSNVLKRKLIDALYRTKVPIWREVSDYLNVPSRQSKSINLFRISKYANENDIIIVPGKVLGNGDLTKKVTIACYRISDSAKRKVMESGSSVMSIEEALQKWPDKIPKNQNMRVLI